MADNSNLPVVDARQNDRRPAFTQDPVHMTERERLVQRHAQFSDQISWTVRENEQWALLGPNGAGKTTLLSLILADNPQAYANDITLFGKRRGSGESIWEIKQSIGWVAPGTATVLSEECNVSRCRVLGFFDSVGLYRQCSACAARGRHCRGCSGWAR